jgi:hypothetical protein
MLWVGSCQRSVPRLQWSDRFPKKSKYIMAHVTYMSFEKTEIWPLCGAQENTHSKSSLISYWNWAFVLTTATVAYLAHLAMWAGTLWAEINLPVKDNALTHLLSVQNITKCLFKTKKAVCRWIQMSAERTSLFWSVGDIRAIIWNALLQSIWSLCSLVKDPLGKGKAPLK